MQHLHYVLGKLEAHAERQTELLLSAQVTQRRMEQILVSMQTKVQEMHARPPVKAWLSVSDVIKLILTALILWSAFRGDITIQDAANYLK